VVESGAAREQTEGFHGCDGQTRRTDWVHATRVTPSLATTVEGDEMQREAQPQDREREATTRRFPLALFVVAELLCTGALVASAILWM
jgi:hypothetical protein